MAKSKLSFFLDCFEFSWDYIVHLISQIGINLYLSSSFSVCVCMWGKGSALVASEVG